MIKKRYIITVISAVLVLSYMWHLNGRTPWNGANFVLSGSIEEYTVFDQYLEQGHKIVTRLDTKPGAEEKGKLVLVSPDNRTIEWINGYQQTKEQLEIKTERAGRYQLILITLPYESVGDKTLPEIEVNWRVR